MGQRCKILCCFSSRHHGATLQDPVLLLKLTSWGNVARPCAASQAAIMGRWRFNVHVGTAPSRCSLELKTQDSRARLASVSVTSSVPSAPSAGGLGTFRPGLLPSCTTNERRHLKRNARQGLREKTKTYYYGAGTGTYNKIFYVQHISARGHCAFLCTAMARDTGVRAS